MQRQSLTLLFSSLYIRDLQFKLAGDKNEVIEKRYLHMDF